MNDKLKKEEKEEKDIKAKEILDYPNPFKIRGFQVVNENFMKNNVETKLPTRGSEKSAGYDFYSKESVIILPGKSHLFWSDIKAYMLPGEVLEMYVRSSIGIKKDLILKNLVGIIDQDYYENLSNDGNIGIALYNIGDKEQTIENGERIAQGIFKTFLEADGIVSGEKRNGGIGSTN